MTKAELWKIYVDKNPRWETEGAHLTAAGLKKFFDQTFDVGHDLGVENGRALAAREKKPENSYEKFMEMFGGRK